MTDREKLIELLIEAEKTSFVMTSQTLEERIRFLMAQFADHLLASGVTVQQWTPASEPPEVWRDEDGSLTNYMVYVPEYGVDIGNFFGSANYWLCLGIPCEVTHWAPLPNPPKEG